MWLVDMCEKIAAMSESGKTVLFLVTILFTLFMGAAYSLAWEAIGKIGKKDKDDD